MYDGLLLKQPAQIVLTNEDRIYSHSNANWVVVHDVSKFLQNIVVRSYAISDHAYKHVNKALRGKVVSLYFIYSDHVQPMFSGHFLSNLQLREC